TTPSPSEIYTLSLHDALPIFANTLFEKGAELHTALVLAAKFHDLGKKRAVWQRSIGNQLPKNPKPDEWLAKSGGKMKPREITDRSEEHTSELQSRSDLVCRLL